MFRSVRRPRIRRRIQRVVQCCVLTGVLIASAACAQSSGEAEQDPNAVPRNGGNITMLFPGDARGLSPYTATVSTQGDSSRLSALYDVLLWSDPATGTIRPQMAESLDPDRDSLVWTLTLRDGIRFTDGAQLDAEAVKRAWEKHLDPKVQSAAAATVKPLVITVVDKLRLVIKLPSPNANFDRTVAHTLNYIPSPRTLDSDQALAASRTAPVGAGPFKLREWVPGSHMTLDRNPNYWQPGKPYLDSVTMRIASDTLKSAELVDKGEGDLVVTTDVLAIGAASDRSLQVSEVALNGGLMVAFNLRRAPFSDPRLRRAVALSLSTEEINRTLFANAGQPANGIFSSTSALANIQLRTPDNDANQAAALFAQVTENGRKPITVTFVAPDQPKSVAIVEHIKQRVETASNKTVTVAIDRVDIPSYTKRVPIDTDFDLATYIVWAEDPEPTLYQFLHSKGGGANLTGYQSAKVDAALDAARLASDRTARTEAYTRVQVELINDIPFFVYQESPVAAIADPKLTGIQLFGDGVVLWDRIGLR